ncbi:hypothetical protein ACFVYC_03450 [Pseudarthrobacter sp. NPDC058329]|uniref:hypothetical protein n=1 Tax=Pseudarthrobacter sp. NPDC058329 TaxID=3346448 RepID=UPI0036DE15B0
MSQEQPPIRSRRELRKARDAQQPSVSTATDQLSPAPKKPAANRPAPGPAVPAPEQTHTQRSSQIRARDRAALRTIKELEEKEGQLAGGGAPTRRQLRLQQLKEQALTAANPIVAPAGPVDPAAKGPASPAVQEIAAGEQDSRGVSSSPSPSPAPALNGAPSPGSTPSTVPGGMTVEQALAARSLIAEQAKNQIAKMQHIASLDPEAVDPEILAEQIALAERAAVMNRRAMAKQKLAEQTGVPAPATDPSSAKEPAAQQQGPKPSPVPAQRPAPSTASNLAMVTPLEFVQVPGVDRPVMKPPATSHVPVTTRPGAKVSPAGTRKRRPDAGDRPGKSDAGSGRSDVIARAEAAAKAAVHPKPAVLAPAVVAEKRTEDIFEDLPRVPARQAHGLDPLDAATAGLARATRNRVLQFSVLAFGILALIAGIFLIISGMSR